MKLWLSLYTVAFFFLISCTRAKCYPRVQKSSRCYTTTCSTLSESKCDGYKIRTIRDPGLTLFCSSLTICQWIPEVKKASVALQGAKAIQAAKPKAKPAPAPVVKQEPTLDSYCGATNSCRCGTWGTSSCRYAVGDAFFGGSECPNGKDYTKNMKCVTHSNRRECCTFKSVDTSYQEPAYEPKKRVQKMGMAQRAIRAMGVGCIDRAKRDVTLLNYMAGNGCPYKSQFKKDPCSRMNSDVCKTECYRILATQPHNTPLCPDAYTSSVSASRYTPNGSLSRLHVLLAIMFLVSTFILVILLKRKIRPEHQEPLLNEEI